MADDEIFRQGDRGDKLYFINRGTVEIWIGEDSVADDEMVAEMKRTLSKDHLKIVKSDLAL